VIHHQVSRIWVYPEKQIERCARADIEDTDSPAHRAATLGLNKPMLILALDGERNGHLEGRFRMRVARPTVKSIYIYESGEFVGSARVSEVKRKRFALGGIGPVRAGEILKPKDLKRLKVHPTTLIYSS
jgi:hypothetical protein